MTASDKTHMNLGTGYCLTRLEYPQSYTRPRTYLEPHRMRALAPAIKLHTPVCRISKTTDHELTSALILDDEEWVIVTLAPVTAQSSHTLRKRLPVKPALPAVTDLLKVAHREGLIEPFWRIRFTPKHRGCQHQARPGIQRGQRNLIACLVGDLKPASHYGSAVCQRMDFHVECR
jgi:hypothetical protein